MRENMCGRAKSDYQHILQLPMQLAKSFLKTYADPQPVLSEEKKTPH